MKTFLGVDYHKKFGHGTIMTEAGEIIKQGKFANHPDDCDEPSAKNRAKPKVMALRVSQLKKSR